MALSVRGAGRAPRLTSLGAPPPEGWHAIRYLRGGRGAGVQDRRMLEEVTSVTLRPVGVKRVCGAGLPAVGVTVGQGRTVNGSPSSPWQLPRCRPGRRHPRGAETRGERGRRASLKGAMTALSLCPKRTAGPQPARGPCPASATRRSPGARLPPWTFWQMRRPSKPAKVPSWGKSCTLWTVRSSGWDARSRSSASSAFFTPVHRDGGEDAPSPAHSALLPQLTPQPLGPSPESLGSWRGLPKPRTRDPAGPRAGHLPGPPRDCS